MKGFGEMKKEGRGMINLENRILFMLKREMSSFLMF